MHRACQQALDLDKHFRFHPLEIVVESPFPDEMFEPGPFEMELADVFGSGRMHPNLFQASPRLFDNESLPFTTGGGRRCKPAAGAAERDGDDSSRWAPEAVELSDRRVSVH